MKTVKITGIQQVEVVNASSEQTLKANEVKVAVKTVGVCGSDIHYYKEGNIGSQIVDFPWGVGHEGAGQIVEVGAQVTTLKSGDRVAIEPNMYCGECSECRKGRQHTCLNQRFLGCPGQVEGCMVEYINLPSYCCEKVPENISFQLAAFAEPLSIGLYAFKLSEMSQQENNIAILGSGPIGLSVLASCLKNKQTKLAVTDLLGYRIEFAKAVGAKLACHPTEEDQIMDFVDVGYDIVFECCGKQEALDQALRILKPGGKLVFVGIPETQSLSYNMDLMRRKEICVQNVRRQNNCFTEAIQMIAEDPGYFEQMITHNYSVNEADEAFKCVAEYSNNVIKAMVNF